MDTAPSGLGHDVRVEVKTREELLTTARGLLPMLKERAAEPEQLRRIPDDTVRALHESGLLRIAVPKRFGGYDVEYAIMHDVAAELAQACGATGWCYSLWGEHHWWVGYYPPEAQADVYADGPDVLLATAGFIVRSQAEPMRGGYRVSGHWQFSSGCDHVRWLILTASCSDGPLGILVPAGDFEILQDTWHVSGLQGTGSKDVVVQDAFVPLHRTLPPQGANDLRFAPPGFHQQRRFGPPLSAMLAWGLVAPAIGMAAGAVDEFTRRLIGTSGRQRAADSALVQTRIAESAVEVDAARALLHKNLEEAQAQAERGEVPSPLDLARIVRDRAYVARLSVSAVNRMFELAGGHALYLSDPLQRLHRDVQATSHRDGLTFDFGAQRYGRVVLGLEPNDVAPHQPR